MKNRDYKIFAPNQYYHIFNRGVGKMDIFKDDEDFKFFLYRLKENLYPQRTALSRVEGRPLHRRYVRKSLPDGSYTLLAYCLMPNHFHFLIRQNTILPISKLLAKVCTSYSMYFNKKYEHVGALLQSKFKAVMVVSDAQLLWLSSYIHNNPKTASLVNDLGDWQWSSYLDYINLRPGKLADKNFILKIFKNNPGEYKQFVDEGSYKIKERKDLEYILLD